MFEYLKKRDIILTLTKYEFKQRYRGTALGVCMESDNAFFNGIGFVRNI